MTDITNRRISDNDLIAGIILPRDAAIERALAWASGQGYSFATEALNSYAAVRDLEWIDTLAGVTFRADTGGGS